ncbi:alpha/beta fold hydrolase [Streptomyces sp. ISL-43]|uniref:alpha/beta fold hydrolase n=1 Tax=Streptomyces sp. ISL-43 TaxID=2819183 RepID=UPI001BE92397|nr:alpha/beta fold hydrolase [Streptomyces sp. ISL-43]MBT2448952.1 alpha/beta fold hydrolase [Streptomyces sp. ISL-43]
MASLLSTTLDITARVAPGPVGRVAFALFVRPLGRPKVRPGEAEVMARAVTGRLVVDGIPVTTYRWGDGGRPVLVVHGWTSRASRFAGFVEALRARGLTVVSFDAPGHGESGGRATTILRQREIIRRLHGEYGGFSAVLAHSFGVVATFFALRDGIRVDRIVGIGAIADFDFLAERFRANAGVNQAVEDAMRRHVQRRLFPSEPDVWQRFDACRHPEEIPSDILLIHDADDDTAAPAQSRAIAEAYGERARLIETGGLGHRRILGAPEIIAAATEFLAGAGAHAWTEARDPAWTEVRDPAWTEVRDPAWTEVRDPAWTEVRDPAGPEVRDPAGPEAPAETPAGISAAVR